VRYGFVEGSASCDVQIILVSSPRPVTTGAVVYTVTFDIETTPVVQGLPKNIAAPAANYRPILVH
jgi:hypothetical protein